jgi:hypothetical protein
MTLGELAESDGLSALVFLDALRGDVAQAALCGSELLGRLGVAETVVVGLGVEGSGALRAAGTGTFAAVVLIEPEILAEELETLLADVPVPKLLLVRATDTRAQETAAAVYRYAIGPIVIRHLPGKSLLAGDSTAMVAEATFAFAVRACGGGRLA